ncbi:DNA topoisomerase [Clarireedia jacksonii]
MPLPGKVLCVAEKPSIAKAVANHLAGGSAQSSNTRVSYIKNYKFTYDFGPPWGNCNAVMTCVSGHLTGLDIGPSHKDWSHPPPESLFFEAPVIQTIDNVATLNPSTVAWHVLRAARNPVDLDQRQVDAVAARIELDLRIGYAFTRFQTTNLRRLGGPLEKAMISYGKYNLISVPGSCQFPTLGFVVDRYFKVQNFVPEPFWSIKVTHSRDDMNVVFSWKRLRLFDRAIVIILFERCLAAKIAKVTKVQEKPTKKWKPLPLTTVELQKMASRFLRMNSQQAMAVAEQLYNKGFISYPRTETDRFDKGMNLRSLVEKQAQDNRWGTFAQDLVQGSFQWPREGRNDDKAHPPIHPVTYCASNVLNAEESRVYEFVVRRFLACCSQDAKGQATDVEIEYGDETFHTHGLVVLERNYLDVYPYENWSSSAPIPRFTVGERFEPTEAMITDGKTTAPGYLTEPDLIALMDANGIGTDATMAEHIAKIKERSYVFTRPKTAGGSSNSNDNAVPAGRGGRGARGGRGGRGGAAGGGGGSGGVEEFIPTTLGVALVQGYDNMDFETSLSKPFLRKEMELKMKAICDGQTTRRQVVRESLNQYYRVFVESKEQLEVLKAACRRYVLNGGAGR